MHLIGVHSAKTTLLAWSRHLGLDEESRRLQARGTSSANSVHLYARDDVWLPLKLQRAIVEQAAKGFHPVCAVRRGAAPPTPEFRFDLPPQKRACAVDCEDTDVDSSSSSCTPSDVDEASNEAVARIFLFNPYVYGGTYGYPMWL